MKKNLMFLLLINNCIAANLFQQSNALAYSLIDTEEAIYITPETETIGHTWTNGTVWDKQLINLFYTLLPKDDQFTVIDFGAQTGSFSLLAKFLPKSQWYSFEPIAEAAYNLKQNLILNHIQNVAVYQYAASNFSGKSILRLPAKNNWGLSTLGSNVLRFDTFEEREVQCIDFDTFALEHDIKKVHFIKIDTEGSEFRILQGAKKIIMRDKPIILMEYNETNMQQCNASKEEIDALLTELGYQWKAVSHDDILCIPFNN